MRDLQVAREHADLSVDEFWLRYFALGGSASVDEFSAGLEGLRRFSDHEYNVAVHALNECFMDQDREHRVPYA